MTEVKKKFEEGLEYDQEGFRMATPPEIANYKAKRLSSKEIGDIGCGIGIQALHFSKYFERVIAVEKEKQRVDIALRNAEKNNIHNIKFITGDAFDRNIKKELEGMNIIHSDPSRKKVGSEWKMNMLSPDPMEILENYNSNSYTFDLPIHMPLNNIPEDWEVEFVSLLGEPKRILTYEGKVKKYAISVLSLPSGSRIIKNDNLDRNFKPANDVMEYIYEIDQSIVISGLVPEFLNEIKNGYPLLFDSQRSLITSHSFLNNDFIIKGYEIIGKSDELNNLRRELKNNGIGRVIIRFSIPDYIYYETKRVIEKDAQGDQTGYLFKIGNYYYLARKLL